MAVRARHVLCFLGGWRDFDVVERTIRAVGGEGFALDDEYSALAPDPRMPRAFEASRDRVTPSFGDDDQAAVAKHRAVAYVLSPPMTPEAAPEISARMLRLVGAMLGGDGSPLAPSDRATAAKGESSGIAHGRDHWVSLAASVTSDDPLERAAALTSAWVRRPLDDEDRGVFYSCGMHLLGEPDVEMPRLMEPMEAVRWIDALTIYLAAEKPEGGLRDGETFRPSEEDARRVLRSRACERYEEDDFFFNPNGYWNLVETR
ncbi:MAG: hypothetical protein JST00_13440 [Deltaproteobacteria bacterium]|nr:hypothetical protein [Deltaproteobacteria bacterium]